MDTPTILAHFQTYDRALALSRRGTLTWDDAEFHRAAHERDPEGYLLLALVPGVQAWQRARVLLRTLSASTRPDARAVRALLWGTPPAQVITVLLALRRLRANHKHTTRAILAFVLEHPEAGALIPARRPALVDCFEHALGKATARACSRLVAEGDTGSPYLRRNLLRYVADPVPALARVAALYAPGVQGAVAPEEPAVPLERQDERPAAVTATNRGDIAATLVHRLRGGPAAELDPALAGYVRAATAGLPRLAARVALVLDCSASMRGYGEREWAVLSQAAALRLVLAEVCERLDVIEVGGREDAPAGATDLALGLLDAAGLEPGLVVIVTDGYENTWPGDLARVAASLADPPVLLCRAAYSHSDDLALRDPAPALPSRVFWHEQDFEHLLPWLFAHSPAGKAWIRDLVLNAPDVLEGGRT